MNLRDWTHRLRALVMPRRVERDLHDELSFHIERETKKLIDEGMEPARARNTAKARFGSTTVAADACRDERGTAFVDNTIRDVQYAMRTFRRGPLAALTIVVTVAIGLGVVAVLFTILNRFLFRVDTVPDISAMYGVERPRANGDRSPLTRPQFEALRKRDPRLHRCLCVAARHRLARRRTDDGSHARLGKFLPGRRRQERPGTGARAFG